MHRLADEPQTGCGGTCAGCGGAKPPTTAGESGSEPSGWPLVGWSAAVFLLPLLTAVAGAWLAGSDRTRQTLGALAGLAVGAGGAAVALRWSRRNVRRNLETHL